MWKKILDAVRFFIVKVLLSMFMAYLIPIINIVMVVLLSSGADHTIVRMNSINILLATNACYMASISSYYKINEKHNVKSGNIKTVGLVLSTLTFAVSTYELQRNSFSIPFDVYAAGAVITSSLCIVLAVFAQLEDAEVNKRIKKSEYEKAEELIKNSGKAQSFDMDGDHFHI